MDGRWKKWEAITFDRGTSGKLELEAENNSFQELESLGFGYNVFGEKMVEEEVYTNEEGEETFVFSIMDLTTMVQMSIIPPYVLPHFNEMIYANRDSFLLEFDILCSSYSIILMMHITQIVSFHDLARIIMLVHGVGRKHNLYMG